MLDPDDPSRELVDRLLDRHQGDHRAALADLARLYLVARHGWCAGFDRADPASGYGSKASK